MKALVFSDIHNNMASVQALRDAEGNDYDALIVAGDLGNESAQAMLQIFDTFDCPVYFVLGNWDSLVEYVPQPTSNCTLVHNNIHRLGDYWITGHSGCWSNWGKNPIYLSEVAASTERHSVTLSQLMELEFAYSQATQELDAVFEKRRTELAIKKSKLEPKEYRQKAKKLRDLKASKCSTLYKPVEKFKAAPDYSKFLNDQWECANRANSRQRLEILNIIRESALPQDRLILLTHDRLYKLAEDEIFPLLHVFGHKHEYKFNYFKGTSYLNASALDSSQFLIDEGGWVASPAGYCVLTLTGSEVHVERRTVEVTTAEMGSN